MVKVTYKKVDGVLCKVWFESVSSACHFVNKIVTNGCVEGFVKVEEINEENET